MPVIRGSNPTVTDSLAAIAPTGTAVGRPSATARRPRAPGNRPLGARRPSERTHQPRRVNHGRYACRQLENLEDGHALLRRRDRRTRGRRPLPVDFSRHGGLTADVHVVVDVRAVDAGSARRLRGTLPAGQPPAARRGPVAGAAADLWRGSDPRGGSIGRDPGGVPPTLVDGVPASAVSAFATEKLEMRT